MCNLASPQRSQDEERKLGERKWFVFNPISSTEPQASKSPGKFQGAMEALGNGSGLSCHLPSGVCGVLRRQPH